MWVPYGPSFFSPAVVQGKGIPLGSIACYSNAPLLNILVLEGLERQGARALFSHERVPGMFKISWYVDRCQRLSPTAVAVNSCLRSRRTKVHRDNIIPRRRSQGTSTWGKEGVCRGCRGRAPPESLWSYRGWPNLPLSPNGRQPRKRCYCPLFIPVPGSNPPISHQRKVQSESVCTIHGRMYLSLG